MTKPPIDINSMRLKYPDCEWKQVFLKNMYYPYYISSDGKLFSFHLQRLLKPQLSHNGYPTIQLRINNKNVLFRVHRLVAFHFVPNPMRYPIVMHKDSNKLNPDASNLQWGTHEMNMLDAIKQGVLKMKVDADDIKRILSMNESRNEIAKQFRISSRMVSYLKRGRFNRRLRSQSLHPESSPTVTQA